MFTRCCWVENKIMDAINWNNQKNEIVFQFVNLSPGISCGAFFWSHQVRAWAASQSKSILTLPAWYPVLWIANLLIVRIVATVACLLSMWWSSCCRNDWSTTRGYFSYHLTLMHEDMLTSWESVRCILVYNANTASTSKVIATAVVENNNA